MRQVNETYLPRFRETLERVLRQSKHLRYSLAQVGPSDQWDLGDEETLVELDALAARFARLQDLLAAPFRSITLLEMQEVKADRFPDLLAFMEKLGIIEEAADWGRLRKARNDIAHQYYDNQEELRELYGIVAVGGAGLLRVVAALENYAALLEEDEP